MTPHPESLRECQFPDSVREGQNRCSRGGCGPRGALCLLGVLLVARMLVLIGRDVPLSVWAPVAYLWQDLIVVLLFALAERALNRPWAVWTLYAVLAIYVALNVPLVRLFSSPLTWPMIRATRGTLADSIRHHLTLETLALTGVVLAIAAAFPFCLRRVRLRPRTAVGVGAVAAAVVLLGPPATARVDTQGLHRNAFAGLFASPLPRVAAKATERVWRLSPFPEALLTPGSTETTPPGAGRLSECRSVFPRASSCFLSPFGGEETRERATGRSTAHLDPLPLRRGEERAGRSMVPMRPEEKVEVLREPQRAAGILPAADGTELPTSRRQPGGLAEVEDLSRFRGAAGGRHVVMILLESTGAQYLKPYGAAVDPMPRLTELAQQSILFENAYAVYPESIKGLFAVLCSRYPAIDTPSELYARVRTPSIAQGLADAGYRTALFHSGRFAYLGMEEVVRKRGFQTLEDAGDIGGHRDSSFGVDDEATVQRMLRWLDSLAPEERFFITYLPIAGHHPYDTPRPGPFPAADEIGRYRNALHYSDAVLDLFLRGLKERGLFDQSLFVIFGDHSEAFGQHGGNYGHTLFVYEENVRVPYLIVAPGLVREPIRVSRVASLIDTAPTILDLLGLPAPAEYQGASLLASRPQMALFYADYSLGLLGLRDNRWKLVYELVSGRARLFDLVTDPSETRDVASQHPERVELYCEHLRSWSATQRDMILRGRKLAISN